MIDLNAIAVAVAGAAVFVFAAAYYTLLAEQRAEVSTRADAPRPTAWVMVLELAKSLVVAAAAAGLVALIGITDAWGAALLAAGLWAAFPVVLLLGSVVHEGVAPRLAALHAGDWLAKLLITCVIASVWR